MSREPTESALIADDQTLRETATRLAGSRLFALDTEFVRESTYYPELCVLQVATDEIVVAVDCLAPIDLAPLLEVLLADDAAWVLHSARQDLEVLTNLAGRLPRKLIDTQIAAALIGSPLQIGLQAMLREILGIEIGKEHTRSDWSRRPLPDAEIRYALDDVRHLLPAWRELEKRLDSAGRVSWLEEDCRRALALPMQPDAATILERTKGAGGLQGKRRAAAVALIAWREARAQERDRPRRWILADEALVRIATDLPQTPADLKRIPDLPPKLVAGSGAALLAAIEGAAPLPASERPEPVDRSLVKRLQESVKERAATLGIPPEMLATRKDIVLAASGQADEALATGWRSTVLAGLFPAAT
jgi:ribonuclease D